MKKKSKTLVLGAACLAILSCAYLLLRAYNKKAQEAELTQTSQEEILTAGFSRGQHLSNDHPFLP